MPIKTCRHPDRDRCGCAWYGRVQVDGRRRTIRLDARNRNEATRQEEALRAQRVEVPPTADPTALAEVAKRFLRVAETRVKPNTYTNYSNAIDALDEIAGHKPVGEFTTGTIAEVEAELLRSGYASSTVRQHRLVLMMTLRYAADLGLIAEAPKAPRVTRRIHNKRTTMNWYTPREMEALIAACGDRYPGLAGFATFAWLTGLRAGEQLGLAGRHINEVRRQAKIERQRMTRMGGFADCKFESDRDVALDPRALACALAVMRGPNDLLWPGHLSTYRRHLVKAAKQAGLDPTRIVHALRHSNASLRLSSGQPITAVAKELGHRNANITLGIYAHFIPGDLEGVDFADAITRLVEAQTKAEAAQA